MNFAFLSSVRFWKLFLIAAVQFVASTGHLDQNLANAITLWFGGSVAVGTFDKLSQSFTQP